MVVARRDAGACRHPGCGCAVPALPDQSAPVGAGGQAGTGHCPALGVLEGNQAAPQPAVGAVRRGHISCGTCWRRCLPGIVWADLPLFLKGRKKAVAMPRVNKDTLMKKEKIHVCFCYSASADSADLLAYRELYESAFPAGERKELSFMTEGPCADAYDLLVIGTPEVSVAD